MTHAARLVRLIEEHADCVVDCSENCATVRLMREDRALMADLLGRGLLPTCAYCQHPHEDHMHENPRRLCRQCMCTGYVSGLPAEG